MPEPVRITPSAAQTRATEEDTDGQQKAVKVTVMLPADTYQQLLDLVRRHGGTRTQAIKQALADRAFIDDLQAQGDRIYVEEKGSDKLVLLRFR